jgi:hypothetical protein
MLARDPEAPSGVDPAQDTAAIDELGAGPNGGCLAHRSLGRNRIES